VRVLVTGAAGFVGLNVVRALLEEGHEAHAYVRPSTNLKYLSQFPVKLHVGELDQPQRIAEGMVDMDAVIHCAGNTSCSRRDMDVLHRTNVVGTRNIVNAAIAAKVKRLVFTSTTSTIGARNDPATVADEATEIGGFRKSSPYSITKRQAEQIVLDARKGGLETVILNPAEVVGPFDHNLQWGRMVLAVCANKVPFMPPGSASFCSAEEVGRAHVACLTRGEPYTRYILAGVDATFREFLETVFAVVGKRADIPTSSYRLLRFRAHAQELLAPLTKQEPAVDPYRMKVFGGHYLFNSGRAMRDLDYKSRPLREMVDSCFGWYRKNGFV